MNICCYKKSFQYLNNSLETLARRKVLEDGSDAVAKRTLEESSFLAEANTSTSVLHYPGDPGPKIQSFLIGIEDRSIE